MHFFTLYFISLILNNSQVQIISGAAGQFFKDLSIAFWQHLIGYYSEINKFTLNYNGWQRKKLPIAVIKPGIEQSWEDSFGDHIMFCFS